LLATPGRPGTAAFSAARELAERVEDVIGVPM
jgi:hypothetical protein